MGHGFQLGGKRRLWLRTVSMASLPSLILWGLLVGSVNRDEVLAGSFAVVLTLLLLLVLHRCYPGVVAMRWRDVFQLVRVPPAVVRDAWAVTVVLLRDLLYREPVPDLYRAVRWEHGDDGALLKGRGVLATAAMSASPNTIVLGIDDGAALMILHQVKSTPMDAMARGLGAKP